MAGFSASGGRASFRGVGLALAAGVLLAAVLVTASCGKEERTNPLDPKGEQAAGDPFGLRAQVQGAQVLLEWTTLDSPDVFGYRLYRRDLAAGDGPRLVASLLRTQSSYADGCALVGHAYEYRIRATDREGRESAEAVGGAVQVQGASDDCVLIDRVAVPSGSFTMGGGTAYCGTNQRTVALTKSFYLGKYEVTNAEYARALQWAYDPSPRLIAISGGDVVDNLDGGTSKLLEMSSSFCQISFSGGRFTAKPDMGDHPVVMVTWRGAAAFCDWMSLMEGRPRAYDHSNWSCNGGDPYTAHGYRLPTDAEWEFAAQYDDERIYPWGNASPDCSRANYFGCGGATKSVGSCSAGVSALGLHDLAGNVWEWCNDWHQCDLGTALATNPVGPGSGSARVLRGGSWLSVDYGLRCAYRGNNYPEYAGDYVGFRVARTVTP